MTEQEKAAQTALIADARAAGVAEGKAQATTEATNTAAVATKAATDTERKRIAAIQTCDAAKGRPILAAHLALETEMSVEQAAALLAKAAIEAPDKPANPLAAAMENVPNPKVGAGAGDDGAAAPAEPRADKAKVYDQYRGPAALRVAK